MRLAPAAARASERASETAHICPRGLVVTYDILTDTMACWVESPESFDFFFFFVFVACTRSETKHREIHDSQLTGLMLITRDALLIPSAYQDLRVRDTSGTNERSKGLTRRYVRVLPLKRAFDRRNKTTNELWRCGVH